MTVAVWDVIRYCSRNIDSRSLKSFPLSCLVTLCFTVCTARSASPLVAGWYGADNLCCIPFASKNSVNSCAVKLGPIDSLRWQDAIYHKRNHFRGQRGQCSRRAVFGHTGYWSITKCSRFSTKFSSSKLKRNRKKYFRKMKKKKTEKPWRSVRKIYEFRYRLL